MDPLQTNPLVTVLLDTPVRFYFGFMQGLGIFLAYFLLRKKFDKK